MIEKHVIYNHNTANKSNLFLERKTRISVEYELIKKITRNFQHQQLFFQQAI